MGWWGYAEDNYDKSRCFLYFGYLFLKCILWERGKLENREIVMTQKEKWFYMQVISCNKNRLIQSHSDSLITAQSFQSSPRRCWHLCTLPGSLSGHILHQKRRPQPRNICQFQDPGSAGGPRCHPVRIRGKICSVREGVRQSCRIVGPTLFFDSFYAEQFSDTDH